MHATIQTSDMFCGEMIHYFRWKRKSSEANEEMYGYWLSGTGSVAWNKQQDQIFQPLHIHFMMTYCGQTLDAYNYMTYWSFYCAVPECQN